MLCMEMKSAEIEVARDNFYSWDYHICAGIIRNLGLFQCEPIDFLSSLAMVYLFCSLTQMKL